MCKIITLATSLKIELSPWDYSLPRLPQQNHFHTLLLWYWMSYMLWMA